MEGFVKLPKRTSARSAKSQTAGATGRLWIQAPRRPALYGELSVPTGRERDAHELKFEE